ncbi:unnamed protein product [Amoebophrya sp. A25]|nr:unnamed protein product [Amoebophrya sp. A25]|eukprot:GSA25T00014160001.1
MPPRERGSSRARDSGASNKKAKSDDVAEPGEVPIVGGFFLPKRQGMRALAMLAVFVLATFGGKASGVDLDTLATWKWPFHVFCFASWFGCSMWVSFVAGLVMFNNLPRHVFGRLQAKLFPRYFQFSVIFVSCALLPHLVPGSVLERTALAKTVALPQNQQFNLAAIIGILLLNLLYFEPRTTAVMFERHKVEVKLGTGHEIGQLKPSDPAKANDPELVALSKRFGKLHGISTSLNLIALCLGVWHAVWIGSQVSS